MPAAPGDGAAATATVAEAARLSQQRAQTPQAASRRLRPRLTTAGASPALDGVPGERGFGADDRLGAKDVIPAPNGLGWMPGPLEVDRLRRPIVRAAGRSPSSGQSGKPTLHPLA